MGNVDLLALLKKPATPEEIIVAWKEITHGENLYNALRNGVRPHQLQKASELIENWREYASYNDLLSQWEKARYLIWCAVEAAAGDKAEGAAETAGPPAVNGFKPEWTRTFISCFKTIPLRQANVTVARTQPDKRGSLATLQLTLWPGTGNIAIHPAQFLTANLDEGFEQSMHDAWLAAQSLASETGVDVTRFDGCWKILDETDCPISELTGGSAGGATALGWLRLYESSTSVVDDRVLIMTRIDAQSNFDSVDGLTQKTRATITNPVIDTIVVANAGSKAKVEAVLRDERAFERINVCVAANLAEARTVQSSIKSQLILYCQKVIDRYDRTPWRRLNGDRMRISEIAVRVRVHKITSYRDEESSGPSLESLLADGIPSIQLDSKSGEPTKPTVFTASGLDSSITAPIDEYRSALYEESDSNNSTAMPWSEVFPAAEGELILLRAGPGYGKTVHTKHEVVQKARELLFKLERNEINPTQISDLPIWLSIADFATQSTLSAIDAVVESLRTSLNLDSCSPQFFDYLRNKVPDSARLFFDGYDELSVDLIREVKKKFATIANWKSPCCVTCRDGAYDVEGLSDNITEYQLAWFRGDWLSADTAKSHYEVESFIKNWFSDSAQAQKLLVILKQNFALHHQCRSPLLLTFTCLAHQASKVTKRMTAADLFKSVLSNLLEGRWRDESFPNELGLRAFGLGSEQLQVSYALSVLPRIAFNLLTSELPRNRFSVEELVSAMDGVVRPQCDPWAIVEWFEKKGILAAAGNENGVVYFSFAHRALLEFLVARHLENQPDYLETLRAGMTNSEKRVAAAWCYIISPLTGLLKDPSSIIRILVELVKDDAYRDHREAYSLALLGGLLECREPLADEDLRELVFEILMIGVDWAQLRGEEWQSVGNRYRLARVMATSEKHYGFKPESAAILEFVTLLSRRHGGLTLAEREQLTERLKFFESLENLTPPEYWSLLWANVTLAKDQSREAFEKALQNQNAAIRALAIRALVKVRKNTDDDVFEKVVALLENDPSEYVKIKALSVLGELKNKDAIPYLKEAAANKSLRGPAMYSLSKIADKSALEILRAGLNDELETVQCSAISGLTRLKSLPDVESLLEKLHSPYPKVRKSAAWAFGHIKLEAAIDPLIEGTTDEDKDVAAMCYQSISAYGLAEAEEHVRRFLKTATHTQKTRFVYSCLRGTQENKDHYRPEKDRQRIAHLTSAARLCLELLTDEHAKVREAACWALSSLMRIKSLGTNDGLRRPIGQLAVPLLSDPYPRVQTRASSLLITLVRVGFGRNDEEQSLLMDAIDYTSAILNQPVHKAKRVGQYALLIELLRSKTFNAALNESTRSRLGREILYLPVDTPPALKRNALQAFEQLLLGDRTWESQLGRKTFELCSSLLNDDSIRVRVEAITTLSSMAMKIVAHTPQLTTNLKEITLKILDDAAPEMQAVGMWMASELIRYETSDERHKHKVSFLDDPLWIEQLIPKVRRAMFSDSNSVIAYALRVLRFILPSGLYEDRQDLISWSLEEAIEFIKNETSTQVHGHCLALLQAILPFEPLRNDPSLQKQVVHSCITVLRNMGTDSFEKDVNRPFTQLSAIILSEQILTKFRLNDTLLIYETLDRYVSLIKHQNYVVVAAALRACENVVLELDVHDQVVVKHIVNVSTGQLSHPIGTVRSAALGVILRLAPIINNEAPLNLSLFRECLRLLDDQDPDVKSSALIALENLLVKSQLSVNVSLCKDLVDRCLELANPRELPSVRSAALITLEKTLVQPGIKSENGLIKEVVTRMLQLFTDKQKRVRRTACIVLEAMSQQRIQAFINDSKLLSAVTDECIKSLNGVDSILKAEVIILLTNLFRVRKDFFETRPDVMRRILTEILEILRANDVPAVTASASRLLFTMMRKRDSPFSQVVATDVSLLRFICNNGYKLLNLPDGSDETRKAAFVMLQWLPTLPADDTRNAMVRESAAASLRLMNFDTAPDLLVNACQLLISFIRSRLSVIVDDVDFCKAVSRQGVELFDHVDVRVRVAAYYLIGEMAQKRVPGLAGADSVLDTAIAKGNIEMRKSVPDERLLKNVKRFLHEAKRMAKISLSREEMKEA